jgi:Sec-independent protein translocase protein TatA
MRVRNARGASGSKRTGGSYMSMPGIWEIIIIAVVLIILFGGNKAMATVKDLGREVYQLKKKVDGLDDIKKGKF